MHIGERQDVEVRKRTQWRAALGRQHQRNVTVLRERTLCAESCVRHFVVAAMIRNGKFGRRVVKGLDILRDAVTRPQQRIPASAVPPTFDAF